MFARVMGVLELLADAVEGLDPSTIGTSPATLAEAFGLFDRLRAVACEAVGVFDANGLWAVDGATSMTAWLKLFARLSGTSAAGFTVLARRLRSMPATARALTDGRLSTDQVRAIVACVDPDLVQQYTNTEDDLIGIVETLSVHDISHVMQDWRERARHTIPDPQPRHEQRRLHLSGLPDGTFRVDGTLTTQGGAVVDAALKSATSADTEGEPVRTATQHRADALVDLCRWYLDHCHTPPTTRRRPHLDLACGVTDLSDDDGTGRTANGFVLDTTTLHRLACDAAISRILVQGRSHVLDHEHSVRIVPPPSSSPWSHGTGTADGPAATAPPTGATPTTSPTGPTTAPPT